MYRVIIFTLLATLTACLDNNSQTPAQSNEEQKNVFQPQVDALHKAQEAKKLLESALENQHQTIKNNGG